MVAKKLTLTIVIPVYNEEHHIRACLDAIAQQTVLPDEVIVVDNNCTDGTVKIARQYPFVKVISEKKQGHAPPRNRGFDAAISDIIGRIDADSVLDPNWVERLHENFNNDPELAGVTGLGRTDLIPRISSRFVKTTLWSRCYYWSIHAYFDTITTWGANMAIKRSWWQKVRPLVEPDDAVTHEDHNIALLIGGEGGRIIQDNKLLITTRGQTYLYFPKLLHYARLRNLTKKHHQQLGTFSKPTLVRLGFWRTLPGRLMPIIPGIPFVLTSLLLWPLDAIMLKLKHKRWMD